MSISRVNRIFLFMIFVSFDKVLERDILCKKREMHRKILFNNKNNSYNLDFYSHKMAICVKSMEILSKMLYTKACRVREY